MSDSTHLVPDDRSYTAEHEWVRVDDGEVVVGITDFAARELGDVVYVDLPPAGVAIEAGEPFGEVESTKSVSDLFAPVTGTVAARNDELDDAPELVNEDPYGAGWLVRVADHSSLGDAALLDADAYLALLP